VQAAPLPLSSLPVLSELVLNVKDRNSLSPQKRGPLSTYLYIAQCIVACVLIGVILLQTQESGLGSFGGRSSLHRSRRGVEKTLFQVTIGLSVAFFLIALITVIGAQ